VRDCVLLNVLAVVPFRACNRVIMNTAVASLSHFHAQYEDTVKPANFASLTFAKITGRENLNTVAFQCCSKQKRQNYGVQNN